MWHYDEASNVLNISKISYTDDGGNGYAPSEMYESYMQYINETVKKDIEQYLLPKIGDAIGASDPVFGVREPVFQTQLHRGYRDYCWEVRMKFKFDSGFLAENMQFFTVMKVPMMDSIGILHKDGRLLAVLAELTQDDEVVFQRSVSNDTELKFMTNDNYFCIQKKSNSKARFCLGKMKYEIEHVMVGLAKRDGVDIEGLLGKLRDEGCVRLARSKAALLEVVSYSITSNEFTDFLERIESDGCKLDGTRDSLNRMLTLDRAEGKVLSRDVVARVGKVLAKAGDIVTEGVLRRCRKSFINELYVDYVPNKVGQLFASLVMLPGIKRGTQLIDMFRKVLPDVEGMYADKDYIFQQPLILFENEPVTAGLLEALAFNGIESVELKETKTSEHITTVYFEREIISNRQYQGFEISADKENAWYYMKDDGTFVEEDNTLKAYDVAALLSLNNRLVEDEDLDYVVNRDLGLRKRVKMANEIFHDAFKRSIQKSEKSFRTSLRKACEQSRASLCRSEDMERIFWCITADWWKEVMDSRLIQSLDTTNPVALNSSLSKIVSVVKDSNAISDSMRSMSMGHFGRICPYEVPQSKKLGVVNTKAAYCRIVNGIMKTAYHRVVAAGGRYFISKDIEWLSVAEEEKQRIADITYLDIEERDGNLEIMTRGRVLARVPSKGLEKTTVEYVSIGHITMVNVYANQTMGYTAMAIPFVGADDSTRVSFDTSMTKQAKLLLNPDVPDVMTAANVKVPRLNTFWQINAEDDGLVTDVSQETIRIKYDSWDTETEYSFELNSFTKDAVIIRNILVKAGDRVKQGDILLESNATKDGFMANGKNLLVAYVPEGYNYEDGVHAAERAMYRLTSYGSHIVEKEFPKKSGNISLAEVDFTEYLEQDSPRGIKIKHHGGRNSTQTEVLRDKDIRGFFVEAKVGVSTTNSDTTVFETHTVSFDYINDGDKMANRHGNKGVTPKLQKNEDMLMFKNGEILDITHNPTGVPARMNIGQILECNLGFAAHILRIRIRSDSFNGATDKDIRRLLKYAHALANSEGDGDEKVYKEFSDIEDSLHQHSRQNIEFIRNWKDCFNEDGTAYLYNPETDRFIGPVVVGINYVYKLIHESTKKLHVRGGFIDRDSRYNKMSDAPTKGASNAGGQRTGTMEADALCAHGATAYLSELMNERGDNAVERSNFTTQRVHEGEAYKVSNVPAVRRSTQFFMQAMSSLGIGVVFDEADGIPNLGKETNEARRVCKPTSIMVADNTYSLDSIEDRKDAEIDDVLGSL